jgi:hypothetical protein
MNGRESAMYDGIKGMFEGYQEAEAESGNRTKEIELIEIAWLGLDDELARTRSLLES